MSARVVLVDGSALIYRAFFAIPPHLTTKDGLHTNATFGFATMFKKLFAGKRPTLGAVVFDAPGGSFRDEKYPQYKAQRAAMPDEMKEQLGNIDAVVRANRFPMLRIPGWEADDVIGTLARQAKELGHEVVIVSSDKDFAQLLGDGVRMHDTLKDVVYDRELVKKKWGVWPEQMVDYLALMGDSSDNIPGVAGIGQKGAQQLLEEHGSLAALLEKLETAPETLKPRIRTALTGAGKDAALLSKMLATIEQNALLPMGIVDLVIEDADPVELNALFTRLEFYSLLTRDQAKKARTDGQAEGGDVVVCGAPDDVRDQLAVLLARSSPAAAGTEIAVFALVDGGTHLRGSLTGLALATSEDGGVYVPCGLGSGDDARLSALVPWLQDPSKPKTIHDHKALTVLLARRGITLRGVSFDPQLASFLVNPTKILPHGIDAVTKEYLHRTLPIRKDLSGSGKDEKQLKDVNVVDVARFGVDCAQAVWALTPLLRTLIKDRNQEAYFNEVDFPLSQVLAAMEQAGVAVDVKELAIIGDELRARLAASTLSIHAHAGRVFNIGSPKQMGEVLFDELKLPVIKRTKTGYSTDAEVLERLASKHEICREILEHRKLDKLINTYVDVLTQEVHLDQRVRCTFQQTTGATGRLITTDPDLQRTPVKTDEGVRIRRAFVATKDVVGRERVLIDADWSQIELRLLAHVTGDPLLVEAYATQEDIHRKTAAQIFKKLPSEVTKQERDVGKTINFATIYGQGAQALSQQLRVERKEAQRYIDQYFESYKGVAAYVEWAVEVAEEKGYAETLLGRRRIIPELKSKSPMDRGFGERVAVNTPIQGSAADVCKVAMVRIARRLAVEAPRARLLLQIHDELVFEAPAEDADVVCKIAKEEMEQKVVGAVELRVPLVAEVGVGRSWGDAK
ncbi:MAG: DNA polymerase I [Deltaproteobacteria bacterium]|nr:DNA polymerase I [Deltaproteobacteria bacterium]